MYFPKLVLLITKLERNDLYLVCCSDNEDNVRYWKLKFHLLQTAMFSASPSLGWYNDPERGILSSEYPESVHKEHF